jgi:hypothetical protein
MGRLRFQRRRLHGAVTDVVILMLAIVLLWLVWRRCRMHETVLDRCACVVGNTDISTRLLETSGLPVILPKLLRCILDKSLERGTTPSRARS